MQVEDLPKAASFSTVRLTFLQKVAPSVCQRVLSLRLFCKFYLVPVDFLLVTVLLREYASAVFLHIKTKFPGLAVAITEMGAEVTI